MEAFFMYSIKVIVCSGAMLGYYYISLKDKTFHHYNRFYLLSVIPISLLLPLIKIDDFTIEVSNDIYRLIDKVQSFNTVDNNNEWTYYGVIASVLGLISLCFLGRLICGMIRIQQLKKQFQKENFDGVNFYSTNLTEAPFSYFRNLFWKDSIMLNSDVGKQILQHEMVHIEEKHSFDKILVEFTTSIFWYNPFFHILKREISLIHEYLADKKAVKQSDTKAFAQMLLASHFSGTQLPATSPFLSSNLKKRLKMLQKPKTKFGYARRIFALPVLFSVAFAYLVNAKNKEIKETNIAIEKAVSQIKKDTIVPNTPHKEEVITPKPNKNIDDDKKIAELSKKIEEKSKSLKGLDSNTKEFEKYVEEIGRLSEEIANIDNLRSTMAIKVNGKEMGINEYFKSKEWKDHVKELENLNIDIPEIPEVNLEYPLTPPPPVPYTSNPPKVYMYTRDMKWTPDQIDKLEKDAKTERKIAQIEKKKAKLEAEKAKIIGEKARKAGLKTEEEGQKAREQGERARREGEKAAAEARRVYIYNGNTNFSTPNTPKISLNSDFMKKGKDVVLVTPRVNSVKYDVEGDMKIFIDGKESTKEEMNNLKPNEVSTVSITKNSDNGKVTGKIKIETKL
ncbi:M56 family metallopeptidase [Chryseobacterium potabilaquae]|uniref:Peptidase M56 domain-containing protein n=1 Tax=Chryseobacterium potabilaquae TaxID=2675057 RepID=A0A6N4X877_9FLAO|nr:M56 family metallopeptidase [Chryseobacterium potabilaquae]CAA7195891.1 hypothetical protein CHRY9293_02039 [Chryseobacterium potabilaquae]